MRVSIKTAAMVFGLILFFLVQSALFAGEGWHKFNEGLEKAKKENKSILIDFYTDWCHWCKVMDEKTFQNKEVAKKLKDRFVTVRVNAEDAKEMVSFQNKEMNNVELTRYFGIRGYPSLAFLDSKGNPITIVPGFVPPEQFINILEYIDQKCYEKDVSFEDFLKTGGCGKKKS